MAFDKKEDDLNMLHESFSDILFFSAQTIGH